MNALGLVNLVERNDRVARGVGKPHASFHEPKGCRYVRISGVLGGHLGRL
jgi:hypothetical protein